MSLRVATDVGGTFTDVVTFRSSDAGVELGTSKTDTVPEALERGVFHALAKVGAAPKDITFFAHGTTIVINAITERKGVRTALITTAGFRDILEIARGDRPDFFNLSYRKPVPFVPRRLRYEAPGRMSHRGEEIEPVDLCAVDRIVAELQASSPLVEAIAICFLHSYVNPCHEAAVASRIRNLCPAMEVVASSEISQQCREYERSNTTVLSAYVAPVVRRYLDELSARLTDEGMTCRPYIMQSSCGVDTMDGVLARPITLIESGPSSGVWASAVLSELLGLGDVISLDIGGTTAKCSLLPQGRIQIKTEYNLERTARNAGYPLLVPAVDIVEIGTGGGSIAWAEPTGPNMPPKLRVGPQSAGADPGPASYGRGGTCATVTDANLYLKRIDVDLLRGGEATVDMGAAESSLADLQRDLSFASLAEVARGVVRVANANMVNALKLVSVHRGFDPRDFTLIAFGGGGGAHACALASDLGIKKVVVPRVAAVFSAWGMLASDMRHDYIQTWLVEFDQAPLEDCAEESSIKYNAGVRKLEAQATADLTAEEAAGATFEYYALLRYLNQDHAIEIASDRRLCAAGVPDLLRRFASEFERAYTYTLDMPVQLVSLRIVTKLIIGEFVPARVTTTGKGVAQTIKGVRLVDFDTDGLCETSIIDACALEPGMSFKGPSIVESSCDVTVVPPGSVASVDEYGNLHIEVGLPRHDAEVMTAPTLHAGTAITEEIIQSSVQAAAREMFLAMQRTAMSPIIYEVLDFGTAILDPLGELVSSGAGIPAFCGMLHTGVKQLIAKFAAHGKILPGDVFALNDPYRGGATHLNDILLVMPIFAGEKPDGSSGEGILIGWAANIAHYSDIGGITPGSMSTDATELFQEGLNLPGIKLIHQGKKHEGVFDIILANTRMPARLEGDLWAAIASVRSGERLVRALAIKYGIQTYLTAVAHYLDYGEAVVLQKLREIPEQTFKLDEEQDSGVVYRAVIEVRHNAFLVDLTESDDQDKGPFNLSRDCALVCTMMLLKNLTSPQSVCNGGTFRLLQLRTRPGSVFEPMQPAAHGFYYEVFVRLYDLMWQAVAKGLPRSLPSGHFASICGLVLGGRHPDTGKQYSVIEPELGGWGASDEADGNSCLFSGMHGDTFNVGAEVAEVRNGVFVQRYSFNDESGGHGRWRGGRGVCIEYKIQAADAWVTFAYTRSKFPPWGLQGGHTGTSNYVTILQGDHERKRLSAATGLRLHAGDVVQIHTGSGGGWGHPADRPRELVMADLHDGYITAEEARDVYRQDLDGDAALRSVSMW
eukprot:TRINITY_DN29568_c0_g1_i1.p1 TRINITY_DN29568_c0_g1~~TRINITY_DN29568_c0_g1_i1.p1  ORF type:complete len:1285 (-),score=202.92 TRINITY_DN29568_c0_g1_i1:667-4521(-)